MTELFFRYSDGIVPESLLQRAFFAAWGRQPRPSRIRRGNGILAVKSEGTASGTVHVPWPHAQFGVAMESTDTLLPRRVPYLLAKELGRGGLGRILRRMYEWQMFGFRPSETLRDDMRAAVTRFAKMATSNENDPETEREACAIIQAQESLLLEICDAFTEQSLAWRLRSSQQLPINLGIGMGDHGAPDSLFEFGLFTETLSPIFHSVAPTPNWRVIEPEPGAYRWDLVEERLNIASRYGFQILAGPLITFDVDSLPEWLVPRLSEEGLFEDCVQRFVEAFADRFDYIVDTWILTNRFNPHTLPGSPVFRGFSILRSAAAALRAISPDKSIMIGVNQPWGEYGLWDRQQFSIPNISESLMSCPEVDAFLLELNWGFGRDSTYPRDPMALATLIDHWSFLGKKMYVSLSVPSDLPSGMIESGAGREYPVFWNQESQRFWVRSLLRMLFSKRSVHGILWNFLQDVPEGTGRGILTNAASDTAGGAARGVTQESADDYEYDSTFDSTIIHDETQAGINDTYPHSGLFDEQRRPKLVCHELAALRQEYVK